MSQEFYQLLKKYVHILNPCHASATLSVQDSKHQELRESYNVTSPSPRTITGDLILTILCRCFGVRQQTPRIASNLQHHISSPRNEDKLFNPYHTLFFFPTHDISLQELCWNGNIISRAPTLRTLVI